MGAMYKISSVICQEAEARSQEAEVRRQGVARGTRRPVLRSPGEGGLREEGGSAPLCVSVSLWPIHAGFRLN